MLEHRGWIYLMRLEETGNVWECAHKVGRSVSPEGRMTQLGIVLPYELTLVKSFGVDDARYYEKMLHEILEPFHLRGEWFWPHPQWINWFRSLSQYFLDTGEYPDHEPGVWGYARELDRSYKSYYAQR